MSITRDGAAPYAPTEAVMTVIHGYRSKHPPTPFTAENIQPLGIAQSLTQRTIQALRLLDLIDDSGEPTPTFNALREASSEEFPARLAEVIRAAYAEVFSYKDPAHDTPEAMAELFRFYKPPSMQPRMIRLFYGLCVQAGLIAEAPAIQNSGSASSRKAPTPKNRAKSSAATNGRGDQQTPPPPPPGRMPKVMAALVDELATKGENVTADDFRWWLDMVKLAGPRVYGFSPEELETR